MARFVFYKIENVGKGEMLLFSIFSFSNNVFRMLILLGSWNKGLFGEELKSQSTNLWENCGTNKPFDLKTQGCGLDSRASQSSKN